ncbi:hypothetical protein [Citrobacter braakii]|uniref:hypothetical protein n=1 Tax=Citrobacter braakii TaxID=57706 RepID=UPI00351D4FBC
MSVAGIDEVKLQHVHVGTFARTLRAMLYSVDRCHRGCEGFGEHSIASCQTIRRRKPSQQD